MTTTSNNNNVLPNTYIPVLSKKVSVSILTRLSKKSLQELLTTWPKHLRTQPYFSKDEVYDGATTQQEFNNQVLQLASGLKSDSVSKRKSIDLIVYRYWSQGLNLLQLSQVDCQLIIDRPNSYFWIKSTVLDSLDKEVPISLSPKQFLNNLISELSLLYLTYVYICKHPKLPLMLIRIQVFDLQSMSKSLQSSRPHIASRKPYFLAVPLNAPHLIHSPGDDMVTNLILQIVERSLPQNPNNLLRLITSKDQKPIRSLQSMHILNGNSRFGHSLGIWTPYADATVDMSPLNSIENHPTINKPAATKVPETGLDKLKQIANLRFKGSTDGALKSASLFDDVKQKLRKKPSSKMQEKSDDEDDVLNEYSSIAPIQYSEFLFRERISADSDHLTSIKLKLVGSDVFAGLHELSVLTDNPTEMVLDPSKIPGYLTGEEGESCGTIHNSTFS